MSAKAGWYADPGRPGFERFWGGQDWRDEWRPDGSLSPSAESYESAAPDHSTPPGATGGGFLVGWITFAGIMVVIGIAAVIVNLAPGPGHSRADVPEGYAGVADGVAWRWGEYGQSPAECGGLDPCRKLDVMGLESCPAGLYAEANIVDDDSGAVVGYTNQYLGSLGIDQTAVLEMYVGGTGALQIRTELTKISCN